MVSNKGEHEVDDVDELGDEVSDDGFGEDEDPPPLLLLLTTASTNSTFSSLVVCR